MIKEYFDKLSMDNEQELEKYENQMESLKVELNEAQQKLKQLQEENNVQINIFSPRNIDEDMEEKLEYAQNNIQRIEQQIADTRSMLEAHKEKKHEYEILEKEIEGTAGKKEFLEDEKTESEKNSVDENGLESDKEISLKANGECNLESDEEGRLETKVERGLESDEEGNLKENEKIRLESDEEISLKANGKCSLESHEEINLKAKWESGLESDEVSSLKMSGERSLESDEETGIPYSGRITEEISKKNAAERIEEDKPVQLAEDKITQCTEAEMVSTAADQTESDLQSDEQKCETDNNTEYKEKDTLKNSISSYIDNFIKSSMTQNQHLEDNLNKATANAAQSPVTDEAICEDKKLSAGEEYKENKDDKARNQTVEEKLKIFVNNIYRKNEICLALLKGDRNKCKSELLSMKKEIKEFASEIENMLK